MYLDVLFCSFLVFAAPFITLILVLLIEVVRHLLFVPKEEKFEITNTYENLSASLIVIACVLSPFIIHSTHVLKHEYSWVWYAGCTTIGSFTFVLIGILIMLYFPLDSGKPSFKRNVIPAISTPLVCLMAGIIIIFVDQFIFKK